MKRFDVLEEYRGIDAIRDYLSGLRITFIMMELGGLLSSLSPNKFMKIVYKVFGCYSGLALSEKYFDNVSKYLSSKLLRKIMKEEGFTEEEINDIIETIK